MGKIRAGFTSEFLRKRRPGAAADEQEGIRPNERRGELRILHESGVLYRAGQSTFGRAKSCDFGPRGARLSVPERLSEGSRVSLSLRLPSENSERLLSVEATVVWSRPMGTGSEVGVAFHGGCQADVRRYDAWIHSQNLLRRVG